MTEPPRDVRDSADPPFTAGRCATGTIVANRYVIDREIGRGGMATVYLAQDRQYERAVALKVLSAELSGSTASERFRREIQIAARLNHPHIIALLDSGTLLGSLFYVMPFVDGESLRARLRRVGPLDIGDAITTALQVAAALAHAHRHGVIHRDIKPENILLHEGHALVADFGIARAVQPNATLTASGVSVGTPVYMSPEQMSADRDVDARSDIYSLGCVLYEMLVGDAPHAGANASLVLARKFGDQVTRPRQVRPEVPEAVEQVVLQTLARVPADRFASAEQFSAALAKARTANARGRRSSSRLVVYVGAAVVLAALTPAAVRVYGDRDVSIASLAVLPCADVRKDRTQPHLADGLTEELIGRAKESGAFDKVIAMMSVARYRGSSMTPTQVGSELGVDGLLYCEYGTSIASPGEHVRVQLVRARDASLLWSGALLRPDGVAQADLAGLVLDSLVASGALRASPRSVSRTQGLTTSNAQALSLYKEGRYYLAQFHQDAVRRSIRLFHDAIGRDSNFALPYVALAQAYWTLGIGHSDMDEREAFRLVRDFASSALAINEDIAEAHLHIGAYEYFFGWNWDFAERSLRRAIALDVNLAAAHDLYGLFLGQQGRSAEADAASNRALELSPVDPIIWGNAGLHRVFRRRFREALPYLEKGLALAPNFHPDRWVMGVALMELGDTTRGVEMLRSADSLSGHATIFRAWYASGLARSGNAGAAREILREFGRAEELTGSGKLAAALALTYFSLNVPDSAFGWLERSYERHSAIFPLVLLDVWPRYGNDPRHQSLMRRIGIPAPNTE